MYTRVAPVSLKNGTTSSVESILLGFDEERSSSIRLPKSVPLSGSVAGCRVLQYSPRVQTSALGRPTVTRILWQLPAGDAGGAYAIRYRGHGSHTATSFSGRSRYDHRPPPVPTLSGCDPMLSRTIEKVGASTVTFRTGYSSPSSNRWKSLGTNPRM